ncbi:MAG: hypothetical protein ACOC57_07370, partial [Acidobacteriota bacterium]
MRIRSVDKETRIPGRHDDICRKVIEYGILALIIFSPLPAASVYGWSILVIQMAVLVMVIAYFLMREKPKTNKLLSLSLKWPRILFIGLFILIFIQIVPFPRFLVKIFSPGTYSFQQRFSTDFSQIKLLSFSLIPHYT